VIVFVCGDNRDFEREDYVQRSRRHAARASVDDRSLEVETMKWMLRIAVAAIVAFALWRAWQWLFVTE